MKQAQIYFFALLISFSSCVQVEKQSIQEAFESNEKIRQELWGNQKYGDAIKGMLSVYNDYEKLEVKEQDENSWMAQNLTYNLACAYSLVNENEKALDFLQLSYDHGKKDYYHIMNDSDLDNIRNEDRYKDILLKFKEVGDYKFILQKSAEYSNATGELPVFTYQNTEDLAGFRTKYNLDSVAGSGDEFSKIVNLMSWVNHMIRHDGTSSNPKDKTADALIQVCKAEDRGINCRMMATVLNETYLSMGFKSRFVTCMPKPEKFNDCHVINAVYSNQYNKWLWMDPSFEAYVMDTNNVPLSIQEVREKLTNNEAMKVYDKIHWNDQQYSGGGEKYLYQYMTKNLYRFSTLINSKSGGESSDERRTYVELFPVGHNPQGKKLDQKVELENYDMYYLTNDEAFWAKPN